MKKYLCWHFLSDDKRLRWGNRAVVKVGKTYRATGPLEPCQNGMHGSEKILDALNYAPGSVICRVEIWGEVQQDGDKMVGRYRRVLKMVDGEKILREFARKCALHAVLKYWENAPDVVVRYLKTGDESFRAAAWDAARDAAWDAARAAAWDAARAAAWDAAWDAARAAAWDAARDAAWDAARDAENRLLRIMVKKEWNHHSSR